MSVSSITASSISLSWSVASGSVASWEVVWRETDRGAESSSGSLTGTSYTIDQLESTTIYTVTVRASNVAGTTDSQPITFSTGECVMCIYLYTCKFYYCCLFPTAASDVCEAECVVSTCPESVSSTCAECDNKAEITRALKCKTLAGIHMQSTQLCTYTSVVYILRMRVRVPRCPE